MWPHQIRREIASGELQSGILDQPGPVMPLPSELDLWRSAGIIVRRHGLEAPREARSRSERLRLAGDEDGAETWWRISLKCEELLRQEGARQ